MTFHCHQRPGAGLCLSSALWDRPKILHLDSSTKDVEETRQEGRTIPTLEESLAQVWRRYSGKTDSDKQIVIEIHSEFGPKLGIGSSSAYLLGVYLCLLLTGDQPARETLSISPQILEQACDLARKAQLAFQGHSSGYDVLTQAYGGLISYRYLAGEPSWEYILERQPLLQQSFPWLHFAGNQTGAPTKIYVQRGQQYLQDDPKGLQELTEKNLHLQQAFFAKLVDNLSIADLIYAMECQRQCLKKMPVYPQSLGQQLSSLPGCGTEWSFKTTGAGGEDLLIFVAEPPAWEKLQSPLAKIGLSPLSLNPSALGTCLI
jgi:mevalonate kinase